MIYSFWLFDRHCECIFRRCWNNQHQQNLPSGQPGQDDIGKLIYGVSLSLRNVARKLGNDDFFTSFSTSKYKLHFYETASNLKLVFLTDPEATTLTQALKQIYTNLYLEYVVKNPLAPLEHHKGAGVNNELFAMGLDAFVSGLASFE